MVRWWKSSSITYIAPKLGALALSRIDWPAIATVCFTPGIFRRVSSTRLITFWVFSTEVESGIWTLTSRYPLSCARDEARGSPVEPVIRQVEQAAVDQRTAKLP